MIVEAHDGKLTAPSDGKSGALFQFTLPIGSAADDLAAVIKAIRTRCSALQISGLFQGLAVALVAF
jgi:hypothetical protein